MGFYLQRDEALDDGLERIAREQIGKVIDHLEDDALPLHEKVHSLRSRCKRMRALLRLARPAMRDRFRKEERRYRDAARRLCHLRDAHVLQQTVASFADQYQPKTDAIADPEAIDPKILRRSLKDMKKALVAVDRWHLEADGFYAIAGGLGHTYDNALSAWKSCAVEPSDEHFHRFRRWAKYLLFQTAILESVNPAWLGPQRERLDALGDLLGAGHDLAVLEHVLASSDELNTSLIGHVAEEKQQNYERALQLCEAIFEKSADRFVADVARWWSDWR